MNLFLYTALLWSSFTLAAVLEERQACFQDDCLRAINGTRRGPDHPITGTSDCVNYMTSTVLIDPTITTTTITSETTFTEKPPCPTAPTNRSVSISIPTLAPKLAMAKRIKPRQDATTTFKTTHGTVPYYATSACTDERYSSACSCVGVSSTLITSSSAVLTSTVTTTITHSTTGACTSSINTTSISETGTASTYSITMTLNSTTTVTTITMTSNSDGTGTGTATATAAATSEFSYPTSHHTTPHYPTPPYGNTTTCTAEPTNTTSDIPTPTPPLCGGPNVALCNGTCADLSTDVQNCGACGNVCAEGNDCTNGVCTRPACDSRCGWLRSCGSGNNTCICGTETGGGGVCFNSQGSCSDFQACNTTIACPLGTVCIPSTCCGYGLCLSTAGCGAEGGSALGPARMVGRMGSATLGGNRLIGFAP